MTNALRPGVRLGVDVGQVRIGVAVSDPAAVLAVPVEPVAAGPGAIDRLKALAVEHSVMEVVLGLPRSLSGAEGPAAASARVFGAQLAAALAPLPVRLVDERLSTVSAERSLREQFRRGRAHGTKRRAVVDQAAAAVILQTALDTERARGTVPGELVQPAPPDPPGPPDSRETW